MVYEGLLRIHLEPFFLGYKLTEIRVADVEGFVEDRREQETGPITINKCLTLLVSLFKYGSKHEWMHSNPAQHVKKLKTSGEDMVPDDEMERVILSPIEFQRVLGNADPEWRLIITMAGLAGLRQGELRGLKWKCVDFDKGEVLVRQQFTSGKFSTLKSKTSRRTVPLGAEVVKNLREHKMASKWKKPDDLVFPSTKGTPCGLKYLVGAWKDALRKAKLSERPFHSLRHTYASGMLRNNVNVKVASVLMGHASVSITLDTYSHLLPDDTAEVGEKVAAAMLVR